MLRNVGLMAAIRHQTVTVHNLQQAVNMNSLNVVNAVSLITVQRNNKNMIYSKIYIIEQNHKVLIVFVHKLKPRQPPAAILNMTPNDNGNVVKQLM